LSVLKIFQLNLFFEYLSNHLKSMNLSNFTCKIIKVSSSLFEVQIFFSMIHFTIFFYFLFTQKILKFLLFMHFIVCLQFFILRIFSKSNNDSEKGPKRFAVSTLIQDEAFFGTTDCMFVVAACATSVFLTFSHFLLTLVHSLKLSKNSLFSFTLLQMKNI
jgi:hypothetical protein